ncbi:putative xanthine dehydrogenase subunit D [bioreactor metagenome]|uniref:Putative xanthine dehydrogenase subunit D n=1 Tax=bioreactor metagenome TaxID=1076179 RepID=A0A644VUL4_9ZZZZ|nr:xanthine dehydrogenase molybdopterin binding subunit [Lentimicrobium sp.]MEA5110224.1 xanthine dehydrogenase molybdopterin binding subunit [Lentimicrobium sp.]
MKAHDPEHESAKKHVTGRSVFVNDIETGPGQLLARVVYSKHAHARIKYIDVSEAAGVPGIAAILTAKDIPGKNQLGPVVHDEPCLAQGEVTFAGQAVVLIAADNENAALEAERFIRIEYLPLDAVLTLREAIAKETLIAPPRYIHRGDAAGMMEKAPLKLEGILETGAQEHWYLETQSALAVPGEGREMTICASSQNPSETQAIVAEVLGIPRHEVDVEVRRMGGAFGGKETQANHVAAWAALLANATGRPVKIHLFRDDDQIMTGKRHRFLSTYRIGFNDEGRILAYEVELNSDAGAATDLSLAILERAMFHAENAYYIPDINITGRAFRTNLPSNTAFRGFGGPQGMAVIENAIDRIARLLKKDAAAIRKLNFYGINESNIAPYGAQIHNNRLHIIYDRLMKSSGYEIRRREVEAFNEMNRCKKHGLALTPVKFGISFTTGFLNQAGALVNIYKDGTIQVNHGGTEMGQGLHTKILGIAAAESGVSAKHIKVSATNTSKVPNTSATAASSGSDLNGMAVKNAFDALKARLKPVACAELLKAGAKDPYHDGIVFAEDAVFAANEPEIRISFQELVMAAYLAQVSLSATGFYKTPGIHYNRETGRGNPFYYYAYGMAVSEVEVDVLTGMYRLLRSDILHDVGDSLNEAIDIGQIQGGFIQGVGWCTTEEIKWDDKGRLLSHSPDTYKIPTVSDIPEVFNVELLRDHPNEGTIRKSKAVGEPPFMLAFSVWLAIKDAISATGGHRFEPHFSLPATAEVVLLSIEEISKKIENRNETDPSPFINEEKIP